MPKSINFKGCLLGFAGFRSVFSGIRRARRPMETQESNADPGGRSTLALEACLHLLAIDIK